MHEVKKMKEEKKWREIYLTFNFIPFALQGDCEEPPELPSPQHQWRLHQMYKGRHQTDSISPLSVSDQRKYKKGNKHKGDYCFVDLGLESGSSGEQKKRSSSFSHSNRSWKTLTFNKK